MTFLKLQAEKYAQLFVVIPYTRGMPWNTVAGRYVQSKVFMSCRVSISKMTYQGLFLYECANTYLYVYN